MARNKEELSAESLLLKPLSKWLVGIPSRCFWGVERMSVVLTQGDTVLEPEWQVWLLY